MPSLPGHDPTSGARAGRELCKEAIPQLSGIVVQSHLFQPKPYAVYLAAVAEWLQYAVVRLHASVRYGMALLACGYAHTMVIVGTGKCGSVLTCGRAVAGQLGQEGTASGGGTLAAVKGPLAQVCEDIARGRQLARCASAYSPRRLVRAKQSKRRTRTHARLQSIKPTRTSAVSQKRAVAVSAGLAHSMALSEFGVCYCWGAGTWYVHQSQRTLCALNKKTKNLNLNSNP